MESLTVALFPGTDKDWIGGGAGGGIKIFRRNKIFRRKFYVSQCGKYSLGIIYCCINSGNRKSLENRGVIIKFFRRKFHKISCLTVPKNSVGESSTVLLISGIKKVWIQVGEYQDFLSKLFCLFCLTVPKNSVAEPFTVALFPGTDKVGIGGRGGVSRFSVHSAGLSKFLCLTVLETSVGETFTVALTLGIEKVWTKAG